MRLPRLSVLAALVFAAGCSSEAGTTSSDPSGSSGQEPSNEMTGVEMHSTPGLETRTEEAPPMLGMHMVKGESSEGVLDKRARHHGGSADMVFHNGAIMTSAAVTAIFWGPGWSSPGDKISGMDTYYEGFGGSGYAGASDEYTGTNGRVGSSASYSGHLVDSSTAAGGGNTGAILAEVCKVIKSPVANGYYPVYTDKARSNANYCAYHSNGTCGGVNVQFAFFWDLDGDAGCDPGDTSGLHSQGLAAIANVSGHEFSEARTDPAGGGWYDSSGEENGDKCAWSWPSGAPVLVTFSNNSQWKIQGEWSNAAFNAGTGFANLSGQRGCLF